MFEFANCTPTQVFVLTDFQQGQSALARSCPHGHPMLQKPARLLRASTRQEERPRYANAE